MRKKKSLRFSQLGFRVTTTSNARRWGGKFVAKPIITKGLIVPSDKDFEKLSQQDQFYLRELVTTHLALPLNLKKLPRYQIAFALGKENLSSIDRTLKDRIVEPTFSKTRLSATEFSEEEQHPPRFSIKSQQTIGSLMDGKDSRKNLPLYINGKAIASFLIALTSYVKRRTDHNAAIEDWNRVKFDWATNVVNWRIAIDLDDLLPAGEDALLKSQVLSMKHKIRKR